MKLTTESIRNELIDLRAAHKKDYTIPISKAKGFIFRYFIAKYGEVYEGNYRPGSRMIDFGQITHILNDWEGMTSENFFDIIDHYVSIYKDKWGKGKYKTPSIVFLKYVVSEVVEELAEAEERSEKGLDDNWI